jgi:Flp pilus assembly protein TadG
MIVRPGAGAREPEAGGMAPETAGAGLVARFRRAESGSIALIAAMVSLIMLGVAGGAVDYARWVYSRNLTLGALDAAVLAGGRLMQLSESNESKAIDAAMATYRSMKSQYILNDTISFAVTNSGLNFQARGNAYVSTPFMSVLGITQLPLFNEAETVRSEAVWSVGSNTETSLEMSLMLDTTGSMAGQKIVDLRAAATEMVDIVVWEDQSRVTSRIALAPFSSTVNVGSYIDALIDPAVIVSNSNATNAQCVVERTGGEELTDDPPGDGAWITSYNVARGTSTSSCPEDVEIVPLTSDKSRLKASIAGLKAQHATAGTLGTGWAWYLLSPKWSGLWTGASEPAAYSRLTEVTATGAPKLQKIAVLMTDGTYNTHQGVNYGDGSRQSREMSAKAVELCRGMKLNGIIVYTVGFQLDNDLARSTLAACASSPAHYYDARDGNQLRLSFRDIAIKSTPLRLAR